MVSVVQESEQTEIEWSKKVQGNKQDVSMAQASAKKLRDDVAARLVVIQQTESDWKCKVEAFKQKKQLVSCPLTLVSE